MITETQVRKARQAFYAAAAGSPRAAELHDKLLDLELQLKEQKLQAMNGAPPLKLALAILSVTKK